MAIENNDGAEIEKLLKNKLKPPRYDHTRGNWLVEREDGTDHRFDTQQEADDFYLNEKIGEL